MCPSDSSVEPHRFWHAERHGTESLEANRPAKPPQERLRRIMQVRCRCRSVDRPRESNDVLGRGAAILLIHAEYRSVPGGGVRGYAVESGAQSPRAGRLARIRRRRPRYRLADVDGGVQRDHVACSGPACRLFRTRGRRLAAMHGVGVYRLWSMSHLSDYHITSRLQRPFSPVEHDMGFCHRRASRSIPSPQVSQSHTCTALQPLRFTPLGRLFLRPWHHRIISSSIRPSRRISLVFP